MVKSRKLEVGSRKSEAAGNELFWAEDGSESRKTLLGCYRHSRSFSLSRNKKYIGNRPVQEAKKMKCYKRLMYKQFVQVSGLCCPQSYLSKRFTHLYRALYGHAILEYRFDANMAAGTLQKHLEITFSIKALSFHSRNSIGTHKHIF